MSVNPSFITARKLLYSAKKALGEKDYETKYRNLTKAVDIFQILRSGIDESVGEAMQVLGRFYDSTIYNLHQANIKFDTPEQMDYIIDVIIDVRNSMQSEIDKKDN